MAIFSTNDHSTGNGSLQTDIVLLEEPTTEGNAMRTVRTSIIIVVTMLVAHLMAWADGAILQWQPGMPTSATVVLTEGAQIADGMLMLKGGEARMKLPVATDAYTLEIAFTPATIKRGTTARLAEIAGAMTVWQRNEVIALALPGQKREQTLIKLTDTTPVHLFITIAEKSMIAYANGNVVNQTTLGRQPALTAGAQVVFAPAQGTAPCWKGSVFAAALYARALTPEEVTAATDAVTRYIEQLGKIKDNRVLARATVTNLTPVPTAEAVLPYRHALVVFEYRVDEIIAGANNELHPGTTIRVARWGVLGGRQTRAKDSKVGDIATIILEPFSDRPDLAEQYTVDTLPEDPDLAYQIEVN